MRIQYYTATSVDGFIADAHNSLDWLFQFGGSAEEADQRYTDFLAEVGVLVMGSTTYEWLLHHEHLREHPESWPYAQPTWVVGGGDVVGQFFDLGRLDDLFLALAPVTLGAGAPLLPRTISRPPMTLVDLRRQGDFAFLHYTLGGVGAGQEVIPRPGG